MKIFDDHDDALEAMGDTILEEPRGLLLYDGEAQENSTYWIVGVNEHTTMAEINAAMEAKNDPGAEELAWAVVDEKKVGEALIGFCVGYRGIYSILTLLPREI